MRRRRGRDRRWPRAAFGKLALRSMRSAPRLARTTDTHIPHRTVNQFGRPSEPVAIRRARDIGFISSPDLTILPSNAVAKTADCAPLAIGTGGSEAESTETEINNVVRFTQVCRQHLAEAEIRRADRCVSDGRSRSRHRRRLAGPNKQTSTEQISGRYST